MLSNFSTVLKNQNLSFAEWIILRQFYDAPTNQKSAIKAAVDVGKNMGFEDILRQEYKAAYSSCLARGLLKILTTFERKQRLSFYLQDNWRNLTFADFAVDLSIIGAEKLEKIRSIMTGEAFPITVRIIFNANRMEETVFATSKSICEESISQIFLRHHPPVYPSEPGTWTLKIASARLCRSWWVTRFRKYDFGYISNVFYTKTVI